MCRYCKKKKSYLMVTLGSERVKYLKEKKINIALCVPEYLVSEASDSSNNRLGSYEILSSLVTFLDDRNDYMEITLQ